MSWVELLPWLLLNGSLTGIGRYCQLLYCLPSYRWLCTWSFKTVALVPSGTGMGGVPSAGPAAASRRNRMGDVAKPDEPLHPLGSGLGEGIPVAAFWLYTLFRRQGPGRHRSSTPPFGGRRPETLIRRFGFSPGGRGLSYETITRRRLRQPPPQPPARKHRSDTHVILSLRAALPPPGVFSCRGSTAASRKTGAKGLALIFSRPASGKRRRCIPGTWSRVLPDRDETASGKRHRPRHRVQQRDRQHLRRRRIETAEEMCRLAAEASGSTSWTSCPPPPA